MAKPQIAGRSTPEVQVIYESTSLIQQALDAMTTFACIANP